MTNEADSIKPVIDFFRYAFTIVLALALSEAFKQFVTDRILGTGRYQEPTPNQSVILWSRFPALLSFLFLIWPFFQGMNRYFYATYGSGNIPEPYSLYLSIDGILFTVEAALFFVMSRALPLAKWRLFYSCILALLAIDSIWGGIALTHTDKVVPWLALNITAFPILSIILYFLIQLNRFITITDSMYRYIIIYAMPTLIALRTGMDYWKMWSFYFPPG
jgi:hypothetical protein